MMNSMRSWLAFALASAVFGISLSAGDGRAAKPGPAADRPGLATHYYRDKRNWGGHWLVGHEPKVAAENWTFTKYAYTRKEPLVNHLFIRSGWFSVRWQGYLSTSVGNKPDKTAKYTFHVWADDGCRLYLDGKLIIDSWSPAWEADAKSHRYAEVTLTPGRHKIVLEYFQGESLRKNDKDPIKLYWQCPARNINEHIIPAANFSHTVEDLVAKPGRLD